MGTELINQQHYPLLPNNSNRKVREIRMIIIIEMEEVVSPFLGAYLMEAKVGLDIESILIVS